MKPQNSYILDFIKDKTDEEAIPYFQEKYPDIKINQKGDLYLFKYGIMAGRFSDPLVREARGIIINLPERKIVCRPFVKFSEYDHSYADTIDWSSAHMEAKIDGSLMKLWYNEIPNCWCVSSMSCIDAKDAKLSKEDPTENYENEFWSVPEIKSLDLRSLDKGRTYLFELCSKKLTSNTVPYTKEQPSVTHLGTIENATGKEFGPTIPGMASPEIYPCTSLEDCLEQLNKINHDEGNDKFSNISSEGFVVVDKDFHRIKIKSEIYLILASINDPLQRKKAGKRILSLLHQNRISIDALVANGCIYPHILRYYQYMYSLLENRIPPFIEICRKAYKATGEDRKKFAMVLEEKRALIPWSKLAFYSLRFPEKTPMEIFKGLDMQQICKYIPAFSDPTGDVYKSILREAWEVGHPEDSEE